MELLASAISPEVRAQAERYAKDAQRFLQRALRAVAERDDLAAAEDFANEASGICAKCAALFAAAQGAGA